MKTTIFKFALLSLTMFAFSQVNAQDKPKPNQEKMFANLDTNKDGTISLDEMKARKTKKEIPEKAHEKRFANMDADANGAVTLEEFKTFMAKAEARSQGEANKNQK